MSAVKQVLKLTSALILATLGLTTPISAQGNDPTVIYMMNGNSQDNCDCNWSTDCDGAKLCLGNCTIVGKPDGLCTTFPSGSGLGGDLIRGVDLYFQAFSATQRGGGGTPNAHLVWLAQDQPLTAEGHLTVQRIVYKALDLALGWDFIAPQACPGVAKAGHIAPGALGQIRLAGKEAPPEEVEMVESVRQGVLAAMKDKNADSVAEPIAAFWKKYPRYKPVRTGRCWLQGDPGFPYKTAEECQVSELKRMLNIFLASPPKKQNP